MNAKPALRWTVTAAFTLISAVLPAVASDDPAPAPPPDPAAYVVQWASAPDGIAGHSADNPAHGFRTWFSENGIRVVPRAPTTSSWQLGMRIVRWGDAEDPREIAPGSVITGGQRVEISRRGMTEWYLNDSRGLEQGFTIAKPPRQKQPDERAPATLVLEFGLDGDLAAMLDDAGQTVHFTVPGQQLARLSYGYLQVTDRNGERLPSRFELSADPETATRILRIVIEAEGAAYPVAVDPLLADAAWSSPEPDYTGGVAWGDWDGDGDLDLVSGNYYEIRVYENAGGTLALVWTSTDGWPTAYGIALGDWDNDGDLDIAVASRYNNKLYENRGGTFVGVWTSSESEWSENVAWGDWDGDGDLDLAVGNGRGDFVNRVYENTGSSLALAWTSSEAEWTVGVAWGDVDNDGDLDLA
ncbi:MAG: VCBS repeat-containing protein, partial [Acidobacteriota bacterium]